MDGPFKKFEIPEDKRSKPTKSYVGSRLPGIGVAGVR